MPQASKPIPQGYHSLTPYIVVRDAARAIEFYKKAFGAEEREVMRGPEGRGIMHAELKIGDSILMLSDEMPQGTCKSPQSLGGTASSLYVYVNDVDAVFAQVTKAGAKPVMEPMDAFWGDRYCQVTDPFGHSWSIATHQKDLTQQEIEQGAQAFFSEMARKSRGQGA